MHFLHRHTGVSLSLGIQCQSASCNEPMSGPGTSVGQTDCPYISTVFMSVLPRTGRVGSSVFALWVPRGHGGLSLLRPGSLGHNKVALYQPKLGATTVGSLHPHPVPDRG